MTARRIASRILIGILLAVVFIVAFFLTLVWRAEQARTLGPGEGEFEQAKEARR